jgi:serine/threonine protein kinase
MLSAVNMPDLRIPRCFGIFEDEEYLLKHKSIGKTRTGFTFSIPSGCDPFVRPTFLTLLDIISNFKATPPLLGDKFKLAYTLASSMALLHASNWLHKSFRGDNILFFYQKQKPRPLYPSILEPYITGFEYARPYQTASIGNRPTGNGALDYYYHPDVVNGFSKILDLYSLGVVLFEIAWWRPLSKKINPEGKQMTLDLYRKTLLDNVDKLGSMMGEIYSAVVRTCLECDFPDDEEDLARAVFTRVVRELETCHA